MNHALECLVQKDKEIERLKRHIGGLENSWSSAILALAVVQKQRESAERERDLLEHEKLQLQHELDVLRADQFYGTW